MKEQGHSSRLKRFLLWIALVSAVFLIALDVFIGVIVYRQWQTMSWSRTEGVIRSAEIIERYDATADSGSRYLYRLDLIYEYEVGGQTYTSKRWRYGNKVESSRPSAFPDFEQGDKVDVYVDPDDPSEAVLVSGWSDFDRALFLFVSQLNLPIFLVLVFMVVSRIRSKDRVNVPVRRAGVREQVRVTTFTPKAGLLLGVTIGAVLSILLGWLFVGTDPRTTMHLLLISPVLGLAFVFIIYTAQRAGAGCVVYNTATGSLSFAIQIGEEGKRISVERTEIANIGLVEEISPINTSTWAMVIRTQSDEGTISREMSVGRWGRKQDAAAVVDWLAQRISVTRKDAEARPFGSSATNGEVENPAAKPAITR